MVGVTRGSKRMRELIVDLFAGGGGASTAIFQATGRHPDIAINHNAAAIAVHRANHPQTKHLTCDVREVDPVEACTVDGVVHRVELMWASPDCTHFSKARGGKPVEKGIRSLADVVVIWARKLKEATGRGPRLIALENVEEFQDWGPVLENGKPCPENKGLDFRRWVRDLQDLGYAVEWRELVMADYGTPTTRKRLFLVARCDGEAIGFARPTYSPRAKIGHGDLFDGHMKTWKSAANDVIDWSVPVPSIFERRRPLKAKTRARIAKGIRRYVIEAPRPFLVPVTHTKGGNAARSGDDPVPTVTTAKGGELAVAAPTIAPLTHGGGEDRVYDVQDPMRTVTGANRGEMGLMSGVLKPRYGERAGQEPRAKDIQDPYPTVVGTGNGGDLAAVVMQKMAENGKGYMPDEPLHTVMAGAPRHAETVAFLGRQFGTSGAGRSAEEPLASVMADGGGGKSNLVAASMVQHNGDRVGREALEPVTTLTGRSTQQGVMAASLDAYYATGVPASAEDPLRTATAKGRHGLTGAYMEQANTGMIGHHAEAPVSTIVGKGCTQRLVQVGMIPANDEEGTSVRAQVVDFLWEHFGAPTEEEWADPVGTAGGRLKFGLVIIDGMAWQIVDIGMRMLTPRELFNAQGFPADYVIDRGIAANGDEVVVTKTAQTSMAGNSVCPPAAEALLRANLTWMKLPERAAA
jgi:DNA (cytosine-5)-methyltransferase 1